MAVTLPKESMKKAKIARRVIEILGYFDEYHREASVMDIVRLTGHPQSSTSELLGCLVDVGVLHKNTNSRSFSLGPRAALLGIVGQPAAVRDGHLVELLNRLSAQTGLSTALFGIVGCKNQILAWRRASQCDVDVMRRVRGGLMEPLPHSASGLLLLSSLPQQRCQMLLRRLIVEGGGGDGGRLEDLAELLQGCRDNGIVHGRAGFGTDGNVTARLLPSAVSKHAIAVGFFYGAGAKVDRERLGESLGRALRELPNSEDCESALLDKPSAAA